MSPVSKSFGYDLTSQLTSVTEGGVETESFDFDDNGNRITSSSNGETHEYTPGPNNRYSQVVIDEDGPTDPKLPETWTLNYDDEGNVIAKISVTYDRAWTYRYDHRNRLTHVDKREALDTTLVVEFEYDLFNRRIAKRVERPAALTENYNRVMFYNGEMIWSEETRTASDTVTTRYLTGQFIDQWIARQTSISGLEPPASGPTWFLTDRMGAPYAIADAEGEVLESYEYSPFGGQTSLLSPVCSMLNSSRIGFIGREYDAEIGLMYYRARYYDPGMGRFISEDPIGFGEEYVKVFPQNPSGS
jgi:RHS repeat-associated protein